MFTGLVQTLGTVQAIAADGQGGKYLTIDARGLNDGPILVGESIAVNGACLTAITNDPTSLRFQVGPETLLKTNLGLLQTGERVNLERSLRVGDRLGGHFVQGHVDAVGTIRERRPQGEWDDVIFDCPEALTELMVPRGSIAVDGVSLTVVEVQRDHFRVMLIPHTLAETTLGWKNAGAKVNLEADMLAKHVRKLLGQG